MALEINTMNVTQNAVGCGGADPMKAPQTGDLALSHGGGVSNFSENQQFYYG
jgi:hypothetical protein